MAKLKFTKGLIKVYTIIAENPKRAVLSTFRAFMYGKPILFGAYTIEGNNYFKHRNLVLMIEFDIIWNKNKILGIVLGERINSLLWIPFIT